VPVESSRNAFHAQAPFFSHLSPSPPSLTRAFDFPSGRHHDHNTRMPFRTIENRASSRRKRINCQVSDDKRATFVGANKCTTKRSLGMLTLPPRFQHFTPSLSTGAGLILPALATTLLSRYSTVASVIGAVRRLAYTDLIHKAKSCCSGTATWGSAP
jgi:hypothetical protein